MEAEYGLNDLGTRPRATTVWKGDWDSFKRRIKAAGILRGFQEALRKGEKLADAGIMTAKEIKTESTKWSEELVQTSETLAAILLLSLESTKRPQQSIVINRDVNQQENGVLMWAELIRHFEKGSKEMRVSALRRDFETDMLKTGEHPNELYGRLVAVNSKLKSLGSGYK